MDFFSHLSPIKNYAHVRKELVPIGIFGSFRRTNKPYLDELKDFLLENGYLALNSLDISKLYPKPSDMDDEEYNNRISEALVQVAQVHIVFLFREPDGEHNINQSATQELQMMIDQHKKHVRLFIEEGCWDQLKSLFRGMLKRQINHWKWDFFDREEDSSITFIKETGVSYCLNRIRDDPSLGFESREAFLNKSHEICRDIMNS